ncbi:MAG: hypothetical protein HN617_15375 [Planctomycetaceae bacterium]|jgi:prefoldin subunit 5|nr:hypothetical protein [Planctomycetaceae bacterium]MBT4723921.1 hypothetical protein [Planctomycetaceae bacterium]MBT4846126.1 hypothetical protein [Planctomycetaceae bacterium]MBT5124554.1 hypothetical protein [Planctomycetaceae bacterium]MBT5598813.1 hypothetical protein [Planctomycetaceae bacterium]
MLSVERMNRLIIEVAAGENIEVNNAAAAEFVKSIKSDIDDMLENGIEVLVPSEYPL